MIVVETIEEMNTFLCPIFLFSYRYSYNTNPSSLISHLSYFSLNNLNIYLLTYLPIHLPIYPPSLFTLTLTPHHPIHPLQPPLSFFPPHPLS